MQGCCGKKKDQISLHLKRDEGMDTDGWMYGCEEVKWIVEWNGTWEYTLPEMHVFINKAVGYHKTILPVWLLWQGMID